jgi:dihydroorotate dehydrogenase electron transfer subunit
VEVFFQQQGIGTELLAEKKVEETLDILGPLGRGFSFESGKKGKTAVLVGGGRGMAPLFFLARKLAENNVDIKIFYGGKTSSDLPLRTKCKKRGFDISCSTDDGSFGYKGLVSTLFSQEVKKMGPVMVYSCGPEAMMQEIARVCRQEGISAEFSLESIMGCGFGACWGCVKRIRQDGEEGWIKICENGPVFSSDSILWSEEQV